MQNMKIIRTSDNKFYMFYYKDGSICYQNVYDNGFSEPITVITNVSSVFSLWYSNNCIYLIANGNNGILLCRYDGDKWSSRTINSSISNDCSKLSFFVFGDTVHFLYSIKNDAGKETLILRTMNNGQWAPPLELSEIMSFHDLPYFVGHENDKSIKIYYRLPDKTIKYCTLSIDSGVLSTPINLLATNMPCIDISTLTNGTSGHLLYLAQGMFSTQLIYKERNSDNLGKARIIWEGQYGRSCSLFAFENRLYAVVYTKKGAYIMVSNENSSEFSMPKPFTASVSSNLTKSEHINFCHTFAFHADEILVDTNDLSFPVAEQVCTSFCPIISEETTASENLHSSQAPKNDNYINQMNEMTNQISQLSKTLSERNSELAALSARWKNKYDMLLKENEELKKQLSVQHELPVPYNSNSDMIFVQSREL